MAGSFRIGIVSDIHYAAAAEQSRCAEYDHAEVKSRVARNAGRFFHHFLWMRDHGAHNHLLDKFLVDCGSPDFVVANGDFSCNTGLVGVSDDAAQASALECLGKLRGKFAGRFQATIGDHELGKLGLFSGSGGMRLASWRVVENELQIEPFWQVRLGKNVLIGVASSLIALPMFTADILPDERAEWKRLRAEHLEKIRVAFTGLKADERVLLFCHDPTALPFLWSEEVVREKIPQVAATVIGHLHSNLVLWKSRMLAGLPTIPFLGEGVRKMSAALGQAKFWKPFRVRLCPALTGIQLLKDGGYLTTELDADAIAPVKFEFHPIAWR